MTEILREPYTDESPFSFCKCGHHVEDHGYSHAFGTGVFCFYGLHGSESYIWTKTTPIDTLPRPKYEVKCCPCKGFEPYKMKESMK